MSLVRALLWGRPRSYREVWMRVALTLVVAAALWVVLGPASAVGFGVAVAVFGVLSDLRYVRYGQRPAAWPDRPVPPGRGD